MFQFILSKFRKYFRLIDVGGVLHRSMYHLIHEVVVVLLELRHFLLTDHLQVVVQRVGSDDLDQIFYRVQNLHVLALFTRSRETRDTPATDCLVRCALRHKLLHVLRYQVYYDRVHCLLRKYCERRHTLVAVGIAAPITSLQDYILTRRRCGWRTENGVQFELRLAGSAVVIVLLLHIFDKEVGAHPKNMVCESRGSWVLTFAWVPTNAYFWTRAISACHSRGATGTFNTTHVRATRM